MESRANDGLNKYPKVWVLGDKDEDGVSVTDAASDATVFVASDGVRLISARSRFGRPIKRALIPGRRAGTDGRFVVVRFGEQKVRLAPTSLVDPDELTPEPLVASADLGRDAER